MNALVVSMVLAVAQAGAGQGTAPKADTAAKPAEAAPVVVLDTSLGVIKIELNRAKAPVSVDNFLKYVRAKHYDGTIFHRVIPGFMVQGGGMDENMQERPTNPPIKNEARNGLRNDRGTIAMARTNAPDSATDQFFINVKGNSALDFGINGAGYAVFGQVVEGMDVVDKIVAVRTTTKRPHSDVPVTPVFIKTARLQ